MNEQDNISLADLSHATLVDHATKLQEDYNKVSEETQAQLYEITQEKERLDKERHEFKREIESLRTRHQDSNCKADMFKARTEHLVQEIEQFKTEVQSQRDLKNKYIDLHTETSHRADEFEQELRMVRNTLEEVSGHLRESSEETTYLDGYNQKLNIELEESKQAERRMGKKIADLADQFENHPATMKAKAKTSKLRYEMAQTMIRWGAFFASICSIGYHLA